MRRVDPFDACGGVRLKQVRITTFVKKNLTKTFVFVVTSFWTCIKLWRWDWFLSGRTLWRTAALKTQCRNWRMRWQSRAPWPWRTTPEECFSSRTWIHEHKKPRGAFRLESVQFTLREPLHYHGNRILIREVSKYNGPKHHSNKEGGGCHFSQAFSVTDQVPLEKRQTVGWWLPQQRAETGTDLLFSLYMSNYNIYRPQKPQRQTTD